MQEDLFQAQHVLVELEKKSKDPEVLKELACSNQWDLRLYE